MKKYYLGYTQGVYDMFHIGHLNLIKKAASQCDRLLVGINSDTLVESYKHKKPVVAQNDRLEIIKSLKFVDDAFVVNTLDKVSLWKDYHFDVIFIGDDWKGNPRWEQTCIDLKPYGVDVVFLPYTKNISSSLLRPMLSERITE